MSRKKSPLYINIEMAIVGVHNVVSIGCLLYKLRLFVCQSLMCVGMLLIFWTISISKPTWCKIVLLVVNSVLRFGNKKIRAFLKTIINLVGHCIYFYIYGSQKRFFRHLPYFFKTLYRSRHFEMVKVCQITKI